MRTVLAFAVIVSISCTKPSGKSGGGLPNGTGGGSGTPTKMCGAGLDDSGCACAKAGVTQPCWPGDPTKRNTGLCHDGTQICTAAGELLTWGVCTGAVTDCGPPTLGNGCNAGELASCDGGAPRDFGFTEDGGPGYPDCCTPGSYRWCNTATPTWGKQLCGADGKWSTPCVEVTTHPSKCTGCSANLYDPACCVASGECCENYQNVIVGTPPMCTESGNGGDATTSIGNCHGIICGY